MICCGRDSSSFVVVVENGISMHGWNFIEIYGRNRKKGDDAVDY